MQTFFTDQKTELKDQALIQQALGGSKVALEALLKRHYQFIYNVALRFVLSPVEAQDLTQEVIIKVITKLAQFKQQSAFRTWLYRIVFNHFLNSRKSKMEHGITSFSAYGEELDEIPLQHLTKVEEQELQDQIKDAKIACMTGMLLCLDRKQRLVFILGELFELDSTTGAGLLEIDPANFRQQLSRARKDLYQFMHQKCGLINKKNPCRCPKKTKGFIKAGWVNPKQLQFNRDFLQTIATQASNKSNACDTLLEEKYGALFKDHPYYDADQSQQLIQQLTTDAELTDLFDL